MDLDQQIQDLVSGAPQDGQTPQVIESIAPVLKQIAQQLKHLQYYIWQSLEQNWVVMTLDNQKNSQPTKRSIYAFSCLEDALTAASPADPQLMAIPMTIIELLFQTVTLNSVDSLVFYDHPGNLLLGTEIGCQEVRRLLQMQLQKRYQIPPNIA